MSSIVKHVVNFNFFKTHISYFIDIIDFHVNFNAMSGRTRIMYMYMMSPWYTCIVSEPPIMI